LTKTKTILILLLALLVSSTSGCALFNRDASPIDKYIAAQEGFMLVTGAVVAAKRAGLIEQGHYDDIVLPLIEEGSRLLDSMEIMAKDGRFDEAELLRQAIISLIIKLQFEAP